MILKIRKNTKGKAMLYSRTIKDENNWDWTVGDDGQNCLLLEAVSLVRESAELNGRLDRSLRSGEYSQYCDGQEYRSLA